MLDSRQITCKYCHTAISIGDYYCPNCGKMLSEKTTISRQIVVYFVSLFVPLFGFWYAWKFLRQPDGRSKKIGVAALILTIISIVATVWISANIINSVNQQINAINSGAGYNF